VIKIRSRAQPQIDLVWSEAKLQTHLLNSLQSIDITNTVTQMMIVDFLERASNNSSNSFHLFINCQNDASPESQSNRLHIRMCKPLLSERERERRGEKHRQLSITCLSCTHASENRSGHFRSPHVYGSIREGRHHLDRGRPELAATTISVRQQFSTARKTELGCGVMLAFLAVQSTELAVCLQDFSTKCIVIAMGNLSVCRSHEFTRCEKNERCWL
jgi:hypothetical protein